MGFDNYFVFVKPLVVFAAVLSAGVMLRSFSYRLLQRWSARTQTRLDDVIIGVTKTPSLFWALALALHIAVGTSDLAPRTIDYINKALSSFIIFSISLALANIASHALKLYSEQVLFPAVGLFQAVVKIVILLIGFTVILGNLGKEIAPILTAFGIGGLAVALALQDTLANFFAGVHLLVEQSVRVGDFVKLESGQEGYVTDIGWRTTRIRMLPNNVVVIPNSKLTQSVITNYYLPEQQMSLVMPISVSYDSDPEQVERVLIEEAKKAAREVPGMLPEPEPFVRFIPGFGDSSLNFSLIVRVREFTDQYLAQHELRKRIFRRFKQEGIEIPFPIRTVYLKQEAARAAQAAFTREA